MKMLQESWLKEYSNNICIVCVCVYVLGTHLEDRMSKKSLGRCQACPVPLKIQLEKNNSSVEG